MKPEPPTQPIPVLTACACPCGRLFTQTRARRKYYDPKSCYNRHRRWLERVANPTFCLHCGKLIVYLPGEKLGSQPREFCNPSCRKKHHYRNRTDAQKDADRARLRKTKAKARNAAASAARKQARTERNKVEPPVTVRPTLDKKSQKRPQPKTRVQHHIDAGVERVGRMVEAGADLSDNRPEWMRRILAKRNDQNKRYGLIVAEFER